MSVEHRPVEIVDAFLSFCIIFVLQVLVLSLSGLWHEGIFAIWGAVLISMIVSVPLLVSITSFWLLRGKLKIGFIPSMVIAFLAWIGFAMWTVVGDVIKEGARHLVSGDYSEYSRDTFWFLACDIAMLIACELLSRTNWKNADYAGRNRTKDRKAN